MEEIGFQIGVLIGTPIGLLLGWLIWRGICVITDNIPGRDRGKSNG